MMMNYVASGNNLALVTFSAKTEHDPWKLSYFVNKRNAESTNIGRNFRK